MFHPQPEWWGWLSLFTAIFTYIPYFIGIFSGKTRPHAFSWIVWCLLAVIAFWGQREAGAGAGAWINGLIAIVCFIVAIIALAKNEQKITRSDWITFVAALLIIPVWLITKSPFCALMLVTTIDTLGFYPTFRKSWQRPDEENPLTYALSAVQYLASILAMETVNWTTTLYPSWMAFLNCIFVVMVLWRRKRMNLCRNLP